MPPGAKDDPVLALLGRLLEAIISLDGRSETRDMQIATLAAEIRRHGEVEREQAAVITDLRNELKLRREADEALLAKVRAGDAAARGNLSAIIASPVFVPLVTAILTGLLTAAGMHYTAPQTPAAPPAGAPAERSP